MKQAAAGSSAPHIEVVFTPDSFGDADLKRGAFQDQVICEQMALGCRVKHSARDHQETVAFLLETLEVFVCGESK